MPVLKIYFDRLESMTGLGREKALDRLPYLGLDIESTEGDSVRVEYNPNRADFSTDYGVARALVGLVGKRTGAPKFPVREGKIVVDATDESLAPVRPYITCAVARGLKLDDETIRQLISMQEDLHNGIGRRRRKTSIGIHNLDVITPPITYKTVDPSFEFEPLGSNGRTMSLKSILENTPTGRAYASLLAGAPKYPIIVDSRGLVLSFPPVINGEATRVDTGARNLFVDVTSTVERVGEDALAILCAAIADAGAVLESVRVERTGGGGAWTPDLRPRHMRFDPEMANSITGLELSITEMGECLARSRIDLDAAGMTSIPRYRVDIIHPIDLTEEVAIGYGLDRIEPLYPPAGEAGSYDGRILRNSRISEIMSMAGFIETVNFDLTDEESLYRNFGRSSEHRIEVENPRTLEHHLLRDSLLPSLMSVLSRNVKAQYPQRIFEVGTVFLRQPADGSSIVERTYLAAVVAHSGASFSEAQMYLDPLVRIITGRGVVSKVGQSWAFAEGRCAEVLLEGETALGLLGELPPRSLANFGIDVPVAGFEIDVSYLSENRL